MKKFNEAICRYLRGSDNRKVQAKNDLMDFIQSSGRNVNSYRLNQWLEEKSLTDVFTVEDLLISIISDSIDFHRGGRYNESGMPDVDEKELSIGVIIECEHTSNVEDARRIALDHLAEIPDYYSRLVNMKLEAGVQPPKEIQLNVLNKVGGQTYLKKIK